MFALWAVCNDLMKYIVSACDVFFCQFLTIQKAGRDLQRGFLPRAVLTLTRRQNRGRGHRNGPNNSGVGEHFAKTKKE